MNTHARPRSSTLPSRYPPLAPHWRSTVLGAALPLLILALIVPLIAADAGCAQPLSGAPSTRITLFHTNDWHGTLAPTPAAWRFATDTTPIGGPAVLATVLHQRKLATLRQGHRYLLVDAGDRMQGPIEVNLSKGRVMTELSNRFGYLVGAIGNHDFDYGPEALRDDARALRFPRLCANMWREDGTPCDWKPYIVLTVGGVRIGFFGLMTTELPRITYPSLIAGLHLADPIVTARREVQRLRGLGCRVVVLLSHCGHPADRQIAAAVNGIDLIVGGHTQDHLEQPVRLGDTLIVQTRGYGSHLGELTFTCTRDTNGITPATYTCHLLDPATWQEDAAVRMALASITTALGPELTRPVGHLTRALTRADLGGEGSLGRQVCQAIQKITPCDVAVFHTGGLRGDLAASPLTFKDVYRVLPFDHHVVVGTLSGAALRRAIFGNDGRAPDPWPGLARATPNGRLAFITAPAVTDLDPERSYTVAYNDFLAQGGDSFDEFGQARNASATDRLVRDCFLELLQAANPPVP